VDVDDTVGDVGTVERNADAPVSRATPTTVVAADAVPRVTCVVLTGTPGVVSEVTAHPDHAAGTGRIVERRGRTGASQGRREQGDGYEGEHGAAPTDVRAGRIE